MLLGDCCVLTAIPNEDTIKCPICKSTHLSKNGTYDRYLSDIPINGMPTTIHVKGY